MCRQPLVSVVIPAHNAAAFLEETLGSVRTQTLADWECLVVDDGSQDETWEIAMSVAQEDSRIRVVRQEGQGVSAARNRGFMESSVRSTFVSFMDADDCWMPDALERLLEMASRDARWIGAHGLAELMDARGERVEGAHFEAFGRRRLGYRGGRIVEWGPEEPTCFACLCWTGPLYPPGLLLVRREAYRRVGLFDPQMRLCEDWDMAIRLSRVGEIGFLDEVILRYRRHQRNASRDVRGNRRAVRELQRKTFFSPENNPQQREILRRGWPAWQRYKLKEKWNAGVGSLGRGSVVPMARAMCEAPAHVLRAWRGFPSGKAL